MKHIYLKPRLLDCLKGYSKETLMQDLLSGLIVGIVALPLAIAFGVASGVTPEKGIVTAIVAGFIISLLGGTKVQIGGPTGAFIVIIYGIVNNPQYGRQGLIIATILAGVLLVVMGVFRLGVVIKFIPYPVIIGFTAGIALTIFTTQIGDVLGLTESAVSATGETIRVPLKTPGDFLGKWVTYAQHISTFHVWNFLVAMGSLLIIIFSPRVLKNVPVLNKIPGSLYGILVGTFVVLLLKSQFGVEGVDTIGDRFQIKAQLPDMVVPSISFAMIQDMLPIAFTIAILGAIESLLSATVADGVISDRHDSNMELVAQGVANMVVPLFGGIPATGAIARTMTNINNGGRTPIAGMVHALVLLLLLFLMPYAEYIPMASLAAVLLVVSYNMSGWRTFKGLLRNPKSDVIVLMVTFFLTVIFDLTIAIEIGLVIACVLFIRRVMETSDISVIQNEIDPSEDTDVHVQEDRLHIPDGCHVYEINGPYFFGIANKFDDLMMSMSKGTYPQVQIIRMRKVPFIDSTGIHNLTSLIEMNEERGVHVLLSGVTPVVYGQLEKARFFENMNPRHICSHIDEALEVAREILKK